MHSRLSMSLWFVLFFTFLCHGAKSQCSDLSTECADKFLYECGLELCGTDPTLLSEGLVLEQQVLAGTIPSAIYSLSNVQLINLEFNQLTGKLPDVPNSGIMWRSLIVQENMLTGSIPQSIANITTLQALDFGANSFSGPVPMALCSLDNLEAIFLKQNDLTGSIPACLGSLDSLANLNLAYNALSSTLPSSLGSLSNLDGLRVASSGLTGTIPSAFGSMSSLLLFVAHDNRLAGTIPPGIFLIDAFVTLNLKNNDVSGAIPATIGSALDLKTLSLVGTAVGGDIPHNLCTIVGQLTECSLNGLEFSSCPSECVEDLVSLCEASCPNVTLATTTTVQPVSPIILGLSIGVSCVVVIAVAVVIAVVCRQQAVKKETKEPAGDDDPGTDSADEEPNDLLGFMRQHLLRNVLSVLPRNCMDVSQASFVGGGGFGHVYVTKVRAFASIARFLVCSSPAHIRKRVAVAGNYPHANASAT